MAITGLGKGLKGFGENFLNTYLAMQQLGMRKEEMKQQAETDRSLEEKRKLDRMIKTMQYDQMQKQLESQKHDKEYIYIPWLKDNLKDDPQWGSLSDEVWNKMGYGTLKQWYERTKFGMAHADDDDAIKWANWGLKDKSLAWSMVMGTEITGILPDGSKFKYYNKSVRDKVANTVDRAKNLPTKEDFIKEQEKYVSVGEDEIKPKSVIIDPNKPGTKGLRWAGSEHKKSPDEIANELIRHETVKRWASYNYLGNGKFRPGSKTDFEMKWGNKYGVSWTLFKGLMGQTGLFPVEQPKKKYKKKEAKKEEGEGWHAKAVSKAETEKKMKAEIEATKKELTDKGATPKEIRIVIMDIKKRYNK